MPPDTLIIAAGLFLLSVASGMLGLGVALAAVPFLGLFMADLMHQVQKNSIEAEVGMTPYQYSRTCGACHAGGGLMETDRDGQRYDQRQSENPEIAETLDGDHYKAAWDKSGVVEVDCLMCHQVGYDAKARNDQLAKANFKWAATAGAGLGIVIGSVETGETPKLAYNRINSPVRWLNWSSPSRQTRTACSAVERLRSRSAAMSGTAGPRMFTAAQA